VAYFAKTNDYTQINEGISLTGDIIAANPGNEYYTADYYFRSKYQDYYGGIGVGYKLSSSFAIGVSNMISYKDDQFYNLVTADAFTLQDPEHAIAGQHVSDSRYHLKYNMFDVRIVNKLGFSMKKNLWAIGANITFPSIKIFGDGTVAKQYEYTNIHKDASNAEGVSAYYAGRQRGCTAHFKDPLSIAAGANYYAPSGNAILLMTAEYFFRLRDYQYIEASDNPGENGYHYGTEGAGEWLSFTTSQNPVFNFGVAYKQQLTKDILFSGGFRTDFNALNKQQNQEFPGINKKILYSFNVYHINYGLGYGFKKGSIILGMQFSHGDAKDQRQIVNLAEPVEYISETHMPLTGELKNNVQLRYNDITIYFGFMFNFLKEGK
jgi:hypothetical protein